MLAEIDLTQLNIKGIAAGVIGIVGVILLLPGLIKGGTRLFAGLPRVLQSLPSLSSAPAAALPDGPPKRSSDQKPPAGFVEHLQVILDAAPNASAATRLQYALKGMTEAEVALTEAKLAKHPADVASPAAPSTSTAGEVK